MAVGPQGRAKLSTRSKVTSGGAAGVIACAIAALIAARANATPTKPVSLPAALQGTSHPSPRSLTPSAAASSPTAKAAAATPSATPSLQPTTVASATSPSTTAPPPTVAPRADPVIPAAAPPAAPAYVAPPPPPRTTAAPPAPPAPAGYSSPDIAQTLFAMINQERAANHLSALAWSAQLASSAHSHDLAMAATGTFAHQVAGEAPLGSRISATGYSWTWCGENIAWASVTSSAEARSLQTQMYNETPPNDGHRLNILSGSASHVGVDVWTDGSGKMWFTEDFAS